MNKLETEYFLNLVHLGRAKGPALRKVVNEKLAQLKKENSVLSKRLDQEAAQTEVDFFYYSSWIYLAVHMCLSVESLQSDEAIAKRLGVSTQYIQRILKQLQLYGLAKEKAGRWIAVKKGTHLSSGSFMTEVNHANWRNRAIIDVQRDPSAWVHYTSVFSMSKVDAEVLRTMILEFIERTRKLIRPSPEEEVYCMLMDFFEI